MNAIVVGSGRMGSELAVRLFEKGYTVTVVDQDPLAFQNLPPNFRGRMLEGDVLTSDMMYRMGIGQATAVAAVTSSDALNAVVGHVASSVYKVPHVIVRNYEPRWRAMHEAFGLQVVSSSSWGAQRIEELLEPGGMHTVFSAGNGEVEVYEVLIPESWAGRRPQELVESSMGVIAAVTRAGRAALPTADTRLMTGDVVHISATLEGIESIRKRLQGK